MVPVFVAAAVAGAALLASWIGSGVFVAFVAALAVGSSLDLARLLARREIKVATFLCAAWAAALVVVVYEFGISRLPVALALGLVVVGARFVAGGLRGGVLTSVASSVLVIVYVGFLGSFTALLRSGASGTRLIASLVLMLLAFGAVRAFVDSRSRADRPAGWTAFAAGTAASVVFAVVSLLFLPSVLGVRAMVSLGLIVGVAASVGEASGRMFRSGAGALEAVMPGSGGLVGRLGPALMAAPALHYGLKLYLS
jgi:hypothetical protein